MIGEDQKIQQKIATLEDEHKALDALLHSADDGVDRLQMQRLKKRKLWLKDEIARLHDFLYPDIIA